VIDWGEPKRIALPEPHGVARRWPHLVVANHQVVGETFRVTDPETIVGRAAEADIRPFHGLISRHHARLLFDGERLTIEDLDSTNGTTVNDAEVRAMRVVCPGDIVALGGEVKLFVVYAAILDRAVRSRGSQVATDTADFIDSVRVSQVRTRSLNLSLAFALLRVDVGGVNEVGRDSAQREEAIRKVVAGLYETTAARCLIVRSADNELVLVLRASDAHAVRILDRVRLRIARSLADDTAAAAILTATVLPVPDGGIVAPETALCALGDRARRAMAGVRNRVLILPALDHGALSSAGHEEAIR
jgi:pSer/pThr/pTyr-binding forkhead associated (FHA) protein